MYCIVKDEAGWWVCLFDDDNTLVKVAGPWLAVGEARAAREQIIHGDIFYA